MRGLIVFLVAFAFANRAETQPRSRRRNPQGTPATSGVAASSAPAPPRAEPPMSASTTTPVAAPPTNAAPPTTTPPSAPPAQHHFYVAGFVGLGLGSATTDLGLSVGGRLGYAGSTNVRGTIGVVVSYHFGTPIEGYERAVSATFQLTARRLYFGAEIGVEPSWKALRVRPYATAGMLTTSFDCVGLPCSVTPSSVLATQQSFAMGLGLNIVGVLGPVFFGGEVRALLDVEAGSSYSLAGVVAGAVVP